MVWETHKVCNEMNHLWFVSFHLLPLPLTNLQNASGHVPPTYTSQPLPHDVNAHPSLHGGVYASQKLSLPQVGQYLSDVSKATRTYTPSSHDEFLSWIGLDVWGIEQSTKGDIGEVEDFTCIWECRTQRESFSVRNETR